MSGTETVHGLRRYLITGGASGIGRATVEVLLERGAVVIAADRDPTALTELTKSAAGDRLRTVELDVASRSSWDDVVRFVEERVGGLDGIVNNAGITRDRSLAKMSDAEWRDVIDVHLYGAWLGCQSFMPLLVSSGRGAVVNLSSSGRHGSFGQTNYAAAKAGISGLTKTIAVESARHGIRCNAVAPGAVETNMTADVPKNVRQRWVDSIMLGRLAQPREIAEVIAFLLSPLASYVTAQVVDVTGGEHHP